MARAMLGQTYGKYACAVHWPINGKDRSIGKTHRRQARAIEKRQWRRDPEAA